jgi:transcriptional regulator with XRE-family HTH domain
MNNVEIKVGANLRAIRTMQGFTQQKLADGMGVSFQQVQKYESGKNGMRSSRLMQVANILGVSPMDILTGGEAVEIAEGVNMRSMKLAKSINKLPDNVQLKLVALIKELSND